MNEFFKSRHFIILIATLMGMGALATDTILPAFPLMTLDYQLIQENDIQKMILMYFLGFASTQLLFGLLADRYGRKFVLCLGIVIYILASLSLIFIEQFHWALWARFFQGAGLGAPRVINSAIVRDVSSGKEMAKTMSYATMVFMIIPILAPSIGQIILSFGHWRNIFVMYLIIGVGVIIWVIKALPETLKPEYRRQLSLSNIQEALFSCFHHRPTLIYLAMNAMLYSMLATYISLAEQILQRNVYQLGKHFPYVFALTAIGMVFTSYFNGRLVMRFGMQKILNLALFLMMIVDLLFLSFTLWFSGKPPLILFILFLVPHFMLYNLCMPNLNALIMEPHAKIAGTVSALIGSLMILIGVIIAHFVASQFVGNIYPLVFNFSICALLVFFANIVVNQVKRNQAL